MAKELAIVQDGLKAIDAKKQKSTTSPTAYELADGLIISLKEARKIVGIDANSLTDDDLAREIWQLMEIASDLLKYACISNGKQL